MPRTTQPSTNANGSRGVKFRSRVVIGICVAVAILLVAMFAFYASEQFLIRDARFALSDTGADGESSVHIQGITYASSHAIESVFSEDSGRSVYLLPLSARRDTLRSVDWVKDAHVARIWPNRIYVHVKERRPVAFVTLPSLRFALIDEDGVILRPVTARFHLPVLKGIRPNETPQSRKEKVQRMLHLLSELGDSADKISEVDTSDRDNYKVTQPWDGRMMTLLLGERDFALRYQNFVKHFDEIKKKSPHGSVVDLRLEDQITVIDQN